jgi:hypothetical protein
MVYTFLFTRFEIIVDEVDVRRHAPEDFIVCFRHSVDRDRVVEARPSSPLMPLVWRPWQRTSQGIAGFFHFRVVVAMSCVPLHLQNTTMAQVVLGPSCCDVQLSQFRDILDDDDREFFVQAWCWHPSFIERQKLIFVPEPPALGVYVEPTSAPGLRYLV